MEEVKMVSKAQKNKELEEKVLELRKKGCPGYEIAATLHIEQRKVAIIIQSLINKGLLKEEDRSLKKKGTLQRKQRALELIQEGKTIKEIATALDISLDTVYVYIKQFIQEGKITKDDLKRNSDLELENKVLELREKRYSKMQIMKELGIGQRAVVDIIQKLVEEGRLSSTRLIKEPEKITPKGQRKDDVQELLNSEYTVVEIAKILRTNPSTICNYAYELIETGRIKKDAIIFKKQTSLTEIEQDVMSLLEQGKSRQVISEELQLSYNEMNPIIDRLIKDKKITYKKRTRGEKDTNRETSIERTDTLSNERIIDDCRKKMEVYEASIQSGIISGVTKRQYVNCCEKIVECGGNLTKNEVESLAEVVAYGEGKFNPENLVFVSNEYVKLGDYTSAQKLCSVCTEIYGENETILQVKSILKDARNKQIAYELLKQGKTDIEIMNATTLRQVDIIKMRRMYVTKSKKEVKPEFAEFER